MWHRSYEAKTTPWPSEGENARSMSAAMIPTGKKRRTSGGGGSGGNISGSTTMDAASAARMRTDPKLKQRTMLLSTMLLFSLRSCSSPTPREGKSVVSDEVRALNEPLTVCVGFSETLTLGFGNWITESGDTVLEGLYIAGVARGALDWVSFSFLSLTRVSMDGPKWCGPHLLDMCGWLS